MMRLLLELSEDHIYEVISIHRQEVHTPSGTHACTSFEVVAGPKAYARVWDEQPGHVEWGWVLADRSTAVWWQESE